MTSTIKARLVHLRRMPNSRNGNPRYDAVFMSVDSPSYVRLMRTEVDSSLGYSLPNYENTGRVLMVTSRFLRGYETLTRLEECAE